MRKLISVSLLIAVLGTVFAGCTTRTAPTTDVPEGFVFVSLGGMATYAVDTANPEKFQGVFYEAPTYFETSANGTLYFTSWFRLSTGVAPDGLVLTKLGGMTIYSVTRDFRNPISIEVPMSILTVDIERNYLSWTNKGLYLYLESGDKVMVYDVASQFSLVATIPIGDGDVRGFSRDGLTLLVHSWDASDASDPKQLFHLASANKQPVYLNFTGEPGFWTDFSPDGRQIYYSTRTRDTDGYLQICVKSYQLSGILKGNQRTVICKSSPTVSGEINVYGFWSPDGHLAIALDYFDGAVSRKDWKIVKGELYICGQQLFGYDCSGNIVPEQTTGVFSSAWSPDSEWLAVAGNLGQAGYYLVKTDGSQTITLKTFPNANELSDTMFMIPYIIGWLK